MSARPVTRSQRERRTNIALMSKRKKHSKSHPPSEPRDEAAPAPRAVPSASAAQIAVAIVLVGGVVWAVYGRALNAPLIFDDLGSVANNPSITRLWPLVGDDTNPGVLHPPWGSSVAGRPLVNFSLAVNYYFGELNPIGYRVVNVCLHILSALLLMAIVRRTLLLEYFQGRFERSAGPLALAVGLLWAVHPLQTEAVEYVIQRTELMMAFCYLATLYGSLRYWEATTPVARRAWLSLATLACLAGMASKEMMASAPVVVLLFERTFLAGSFREAWRRSWPLYVGLAATWVLLLCLNIGGPRSNSAGFDLGVSAWAWWATQAKVIWLYLKLVVWPWPLMIHYDIPYLDALGVAWPWLLGTALLVAAIAFLVWLNHPAGFLGTSVLLILSPTLIVPITTEVAAERRMYLPLAAVLALAFVGGYALLQRFARGSSDDSAQSALPRWLPVAAGGAVVGLALVASIVSARRLESYRDDLILWEETLRCWPDDPLVYHCLGGVLARRDRLPEAAENYQKALAISPDFASAHVSLGHTLKQMHRTQEALPHLERAVELRPDYPEAHFILGNALVEAGRPTEALAHFQRATELDPYDARFPYNWATTLFRLGHAEEAVALYTRALKLKPDYVEAHTNLAVALTQLGLSQEAVKHLERAVELNPDYAEAQNNLGYQLQHAGRTPEAIERFELALKLNPDSVEAELNLGSALASADRTEEAIPHFERAVELNPDQAVAQSNLAHALEISGRLDEAPAHYEVALRLRPDDFRLYSKLVEVYGQLHRPAEAVATAERALKLARSTGETEQAEQIEAWLTSHHVEIPSPRDNASTADATATTP